MRASRSASFGSIFPLWAPCLGGGAPRCPAAALAPPARPRPESASLLSGPPGPPSGELRPD
eukprot:281991-Prorocentrum_minimum.AAC.5